MNYSEWLPLFGLPANDSRVVAALEKYGIIDPVTLGPQELTTSVDLRNEGFSVGFVSEYKLRKGVADLPILSSVTMMVILGKNARKWKTYTGSLPNGLNIISSKDDVASTLGEPANLDEFFNSARWTTNGLELGILFTDDWAQIKRIGLSLPVVI